MMNEIYQRGPIVCAIYASDKFLQYYVGILVGQTEIKTFNYEIVVIGWGVSENGIKYWLAKDTS